MLPVPDLNFVVCGIATIAATVGYACVRHVRPLPSRAAQRLDCPEDNSSREERFEISPGELNPNAENTKSDLEEAETTGLVTAGDNSLKRKRSRDQDEPDLDIFHGYPHNLKSIYPNKRRSGSVSSEQGPNETAEAMTPAVDSSTDEQPQIVVGDSDYPASVSSASVSSPPPKPDAVEDTPISDSVSSPSPKPDVFKDTRIPEAPTAEPVLTETPRVLSEPPRFIFPQTPPRITQFPSTRSPASAGFASFAGSSSPFAAKDSVSVFGKPIWAGTAEAAMPAVETATRNPDIDHEEKNGLPPALGAGKTPAPATQTYPTGEEEEDVALDLKGVKLFVKRGAENFSGGMVGHLKVLSHKTTRTKRLLFRREPLWKVSMNVRMQPAVRFSFDSQENILRVALKELQEKSESDEPASQTVIYAFKPGRSCRRCDFQDFAEGLLAQARAGEQ
ncbi:hypothetical protein B0H17DRAFT_362188 [Mycena rosella]|uniref:RanBD1 domain-containing protein n=1 Tax=Mycena rosella TaxID=1033263 RepID=A0AAD7MAY5_MYCRO|nr:hypothetical protein B0H17DRAFT_362188 [Mycena rosella]